MIKRVIRETTIRQRESGPGRASPCKRWAGEEGRPVRIQPSDAKPKGRLNRLDFRVLSFKVRTMLSDYISAAMRQAEYELMEDGRYFGWIKSCRGCWAEARTLEACREALQSTLEDWLLLGLQLGHRLPVLDGINLNRSKTRAARHVQTDKA